MNSKRFGSIIIIAVLSTFLVIGSATARTIMSYNTAYAAGGVNASSSTATGTTQINPYTSTKILLQDGISALQQDNDTSKALTHLKLAYQQLTSIGENSSSTVQPTKILLQDGISALQQDNDISKTLVYMKLAYQQLSSPSNTASLPSSAVSNHVGPVATSPTPLSSSSSASSSTNRIIVNNIPPTQKSGNTPPKTSNIASPNPLKAPAKKKPTHICGTQLPDSVGSVAIVPCKNASSPIVDSPHCDRPGYPLCYDLGHGAYNGGPCPSGHSRNYCVGWKDAANGREDDNLL